MLERLRDAAPLVVGRDERARSRALQLAPAQRRLGVQQRADVPGEALLDRVQPGVGDAVLLDDDLAATLELVDRVADRGAAEQPLGLRLQLRAGEMAVALGLGLRERVQDAGGEAIGCVGRRVERARERVGGGEADAVELADLVGLALQLRDRAGAEVARDAARRGAVDAVGVEKQPQLAQLALVAPRLHGADEAARADPRDRPEDLLGVAVDRRQHLAGAEALDEPHGGERPDVLDALQVRADRVVADGLLHPHARGLKLPAVTRMALPAAVDGDRLALVDVRQRPDDHDVVAVVGARVEHGEVAVGHAPAHARDLDGQLAGRDVARSRLELGGIDHACSLAGALDGAAI